MYSAIIRHSVTYPRRRGYVILSSVTRQRIHGAVDTLFRHSARVRARGRDSIYPPPRRRAPARLVASRPRGGRGPGFCGCRAWKRSTACRPSTSAAFSQVGRAYPVHSTKYCSFLQRPKIRESRISSTWYSSSPSTSTGGGGSWCWPGNGSWDACSRRGTWKTGWVRMLAGRARRTAYGVRRRGSATTSNGPRRRWSSFGEGRRVMIFRAFSQTRSPGRKRGAGGRLRSALSA